MSHWEAAAGDEQPRQHEPRPNKKTSAKVGISYEESVEEALCFGWIDGAIKGIDVETYAGRFTPRRPKSPWSESNRSRVARLLQEGRVTEAGLATLPADLR